MQSGLRHSLRSGNDSHVFLSLTLITLGRQQDACYCAFVVVVFSLFTSFTWLEDGDGGGGWVGRWTGEGYFMQYAQSNAAEGEKGVIKMDKVAIWYCDSQRKLRLKGRA